MNITIKTIPHTEHRYETVGDWWFDKDGLQIRVSTVGDWKAEALVAFHELAEALVCQKQGVTQEEVDTFDLEYEAERQSGDESEPGNDPTAPYYNAHQFATIVEKMLARELGVNWQDYECKLLDAK